MWLLAIIYLAFISLGLPDAVLGAAWPAMQQTLQAPVEDAGLVALVVSLGTVVASLMTVRGVQRLGIGLTVTASVALTGLALIGFAMAQTVWMLLVLALGLGIGAGAVDAALNNFVALHYRAKHMNYLHSFWGVGATTGPLIMAHYMALSEGWRAGYWAMGLAQLVLVGVLLCTLPLWQRSAHSPKGPAPSFEQASPQGLLSNRQALRLKGVPVQMLVFFCYCSVELGTGLWAASYLILEKGSATAEAAFWVAMYYGGITVGRFLAGLLTPYLTEVRMIRLGVALILGGALLMVLPGPSWVAKGGLLMIGLGCAPVFPTMLHLTPRRFGQPASQAIMGLSMATAYVGNMLVPVTLGFMLKATSFALLPVVVVGLAGVLLWGTERLRRCALGRAKSELETRSETVKKDGCDE